MPLQTLPPQRTSVQPIELKPLNKASQIGQPPIEEKPQAEPRSIAFRIGEFGDTLLKLKKGTEFKTHEDTFMELLNHIHHRPPTDCQDSGLFGSETSIQEELIYLLSTAIDSARNLSSNDRKTLRGRLNDSMIELMRKGSYFQNAVDIENKIVGARRFPMSEPVIFIGTTPPNRTRTPDLPPTKDVAKKSGLNINGTTYHIHPTTAGRSGNAVAFDCLAYALQPNNDELTPGYRKIIFTKENIESQLTKLSVDIDINDLQRLILTNYPKLKVETPVTISSLSEALAKHIQSSNCMLDFTIAGGIFAAERKQPIISVTRHPDDFLTFNVLNKEGQLIYQGDDLSKVEDEITNAKFIHNSNGVHFERMLPTEGLVTT